MKQIRLYLAIVLPLLAGIFAITYYGGNAHPAQVSPAEGAGFDPAKFLKAAFHNPLSMILIQLIVILAVAKVVGWLFTKIRQQSVMGEIVAGIMLGPSLLGWIAPEFSASLFPKDSLVHLNILSQLGLLIFMFCIGMELDIDAIHKHFGKSMVISHSSIAVPFLLGTGFAWFTYERFGVAKSGFVAYSLFMGIAMSITAFPVLARILKERGMTTGYLGSMALMCAAIDDVSAWCILPVVVAITKAESMQGVVVTVILTAIFVSMMIFVVKPALQKYYERQQKRGIEFIAIALFVLLASALTSEIIGIHALFGAFIAGAVLPGSKELRHNMTERLEGVSVSLLLPIFFVLTGLRTKINVLTDPTLLPVFFIILGLAISGKLIGSAVAARFSGFNWRDSIGIGALMNTRGLMELIVLNIGFDLGVLKQEVFSMMVFMALITTFMTAPILDQLERPSAAAAPKVSH
ncbi:MAG: cation:proton antiporter [Bacteroidetes bacterium]|nr:cation:proton antiporter [Bacteroidota bacterium]